MRGLIGQDAADWFVASRAASRIMSAIAFAAQGFPGACRGVPALGFGRNLREACKPLRASIDELLARARQEADTPVRPFWPRLVQGPGTFAALKPPQLQSQRSVVSLGWSCCGTQTHRARLDPHRGYGASF